ncbi:L-rhamnose mutarotase [Microbulbifer rhizosphaerae]|uniref:L-rhamnose mutarotase n=1 Tax=Microbulbifer rhizosphaerae TaxID=1562603 RepID=A0A7W4WBN1_9GAMM|nr:L-rhamnose mutarotase [Microbulbifer rhizosphaerae]MBB3061250.1 L-rhamnose mutarotase [Microbulbifer rhizosphaerae]
MGGFLVRDLLEFIRFIAMKKIAFVMQLKAGFEMEYKKRHDEIWPELVEELKSAGIEDYSIYLHRQTLQLFAVLKRTENHGMDELPQRTAMQKWWAYMADIMDTAADKSPKTTQLQPVFHLD